MGAFLSHLFSAGPEAVNIVINFENPPTELDGEEKEVYTSVSSVLSRAPKILQDLGEYKGCEDAIRAAITTPTAESEAAAWDLVQPAVLRLEEFYVFSTELETVFPKLLVELCEKDEPTKTFKSKQALARLLADMFDFVLQFDDKKMINPAIQNDFSYYRRTLSRHKLNKNIQQTGLIKDERANRMSLFFAYPTPMMKVLSDSTSKYQNKEKPAKVADALAIMANICQEMVTKNQFSRFDTNMLCLRAMTGCIILYDHIHTGGAFIKKSPINIKACILALKEFQKDKAEGSPTEGLLNALRFTTLHLNDPDTPSNIKTMLNS